MYLVLLSVDLSIYIYMYAQALGCVGRYSHPNPLPANTWALYIGFEKFGGHKERLTTTIGPLSEAGEAS